MDAANDTTALDGAHGRPAHAPARFTADAALSGAATFWLLAALLGQWAFLYYIASFYGVSTLTGDLEIWNRLAALGRSPYVPGDAAGNFAFAAHALGAGIVAFGGALQLIPQIRKHAPAFHRWNGRIFLATVVALSLSGFYLVWGRRTAPSNVEGLSTTLNGLLILVFALLAYRTARARLFTAHRRWAMRLYLVSNAQWFLRVGLFGYFAVNQALGNKDASGGTFMYFWTFGCYLAPLVMLELYLRAKDSGHPVAKAVVATSLVVLTLLMAVGIFAFGMFSRLIVSGAPLELPG